MYPVLEQGGAMTYSGRWHQDIKLKNILIKRRPGGSVYEIECKLADLGLSHFKKSLSGQEESTDTAAYGTRTYGNFKVARFEVVSVNNCQVLQNASDWVATSRTRISPSNEM